MGGDQGGDLFSTPANNANMPADQPGMGGQMSAASNPAMMDQDTPSLNLPQVSTPLLSHVSGNPSQSKAHNNPQYQAVPPEPVPPPVPVAPPPIQEPLPQPMPVDPPMPLPPPPPDMPVPPPAMPIVPAMPAQSAPIPPTPPAFEPAPQHKPAEPGLPKAVIDVMDERTLKDIEKAVDSPHTKSIGRDMGGKTLQDIEKKVASTEHNEKQKAQEKSEPPASAKLPLQYEAIPSEPAEKPQVNAGSVPPPPPAQPKPPAAQTAGPAVPPIVGHSSSPVQNEDKHQDLDEAKIRARIDAALAASDPKPLPARKDLNAGGELDVGHEESKDDGKDKEPELKNVHIDPTTGMLQYLDDPALPKDDTAAPNSGPTSPPPVPPPMSFPQPPGAPGASASPVVA
jgi:hypothetical protein